MPFARVPKCIEMDFSLHRCTKEKCNMVIEFNIPFHESRKQIHLLNSPLLPNSKIPADLHTAHIHKVKMNSFHDAIERKASWNGKLAEPEVRKVGRSVYDAAKSVVLCNWDTGYESRLCGIDLCRQFRN